MLQIPLWAVVVFLTVSHWAVVLAAIVGLGLLAWLASGAWRWVFGVPATLLAMLLVFSGAVWLVK